VAAGICRETKNLSARVISLIVLFGLVPPGASHAQSVPVLAPGLHTRTLERAGYPTVGYAIVVPPGYNRGTKTPLVLALHFGVQGGPSQFAGRDLVQILVGPAFAELGAIILAPDVLNGGPWDRPENDEAVLALLDAVARTYNIDATRVVVTGYSMGGAGTWYFAGKYPDRFTAAVPVAGRPPAAIGMWRVPVFAVHSRRDQVMPIAGTEKRIEDLKRAGVTAELVALDGPTHYQTGGHVQGLRQAVPWLRQLWNGRGQ
jgi:predicted peptidase